MNKIHGTIKMKISITTGQVKQDIKNVHNQFIKKRNNELLHIQSAMARHHSQDGAIEKRIKSLYHDG
jgi:hypothetical protein